MGTEDQNTQYVCRYKGGRIHPTQWEKSQCLLLEDSDSCHRNGHCEWVAGDPHPQNKCIVNPEIFHFQVLNDPEFLKTGRECWDRYLRKKECEEKSACSWK